MANIIVENEDPNRKNDANEWRGIENPTKKKNKLNNIPLDMVETE